MLRSPTSALTAVALLATAFILLSASPPPPRSPRSRFKPGAASSPSTPSLAIPSRSSAAKPPSLSRRNRNPLLNFQLSTFDFQPLHWLVTHLTDPATADTLPVIRIVHPQVLALAGQPTEKPTRLSFDDLRPHLDAIRAAAETTQAADLPDTDPYQRAILALDNQLHTYVALFHHAGEGTIRPRVVFQYLTPAPGSSRAGRGNLTPSATDGARGRRRAGSGGRRHRASPGWARGPR